MGDHVDIIQYLEEVLSTLDDDLADSEYLQGYQDALQEIYDLINEVP